MPEGYLHLTCEQPARFTRSCTSEQLASPHRAANWRALGFFTCALPEEFGGSGMGFVESVLMAEQISRVSASWRLPFNMQNLGPSLTVAKFGTPEQKKKYIPAGSRARSSASSP